MTYGKFEISHQEYDRLQAMEYSQRRVEIKSMIPDSIKVGNGLYGYSTRIIGFLPWTLFYWIECGRCGASGGRCQTVDKAVDAWNRRTV